MYIHKQSKNNSLVHATSPDRTSTRVCKGNWTPNICFLSLPMTLQSDLRESRLRFDTIKKKMLMCWLATDQNDLQAFPEISLGKGVELKQEKIKRPITVSYFKLEFVLADLEFGTLISVTSSARAEDMYPLMHFA